MLPDHGWLLFNEQPSVILIPLRCDYIRSNVMETLSTR